MKTGASNIHKLMGIGLIVVSLNYIDGYLTELVSDTKLTLQPIGQITSVDTQTKIANRNPLPLAKGIAENGANSVGAKISDSIFYQAKKDEPEIIVVAEVADDKPDYQSILKEKLLINSASRKGAIVNGHFYRVGQSILGADVYTSDGSVLSPKLVRISNKMNALTFKIESEYITLYI